MNNHKSHYYVHASGIQLCIIIHIYILVMYMVLVRIDVPKERRFSIQTESMSTV